MTALRKMIEDVAGVDMMGGSSSGEKEQTRHDGGSRRGVEGGQDEEVVYV